MKTAITLSVLPWDIQDLMYQQAASFNDCQDAKSRAKGLVQNHVARSQTSPMEVGKVDAEKAEDAMRTTGRSTTPARAREKEMVPAIFVDRWDVSQGSAPRGHK